MPSPARLSLFVLVALAVASTAQAQVRPAPAAPSASSVVPARLASDAAPGARILRDDDGLIRRAWGLSIHVEGADPEAQARAFVGRYARELALFDGARLALQRVLDTRGRTVVRFRRVELGGPVVGGSVVVRLSGGVVDYVGLHGVAAPPSAAARSIDRDAAVARALSGDERALTAVPGALELDGWLIPVWSVDAAGAQLHERRRVIVDGRDGAILLSHPLALDAMGRVFDHNPTTDDGVTTDVELTHLTSRDHLTGRHFRVLSCNASDAGCDPAQIATADDAGDFLYEPDDPSFDDAFVEVNAYHHANLVAGYFRDTHDFTWSCGTDALMRVFVNYTERGGLAYDNAAYSPSSGSECGFMLFGQGRDKDFAYDSDVIYHEFGHGMVDGTSGIGFFLIDPLGVSYEPGAVNEATADYFAATVSGDPLMAEYFAGSSGLSGEGALRRLDNDLVCPNDLIGEVHFDGRIWAALAWDLREAIGPEKTDALVFDTVGALDMVPSLSAATETLLATADAMMVDGALTADDRLTIDEAVDARGLLGCERVAPLDDGEPHLAYSGQGELTASAGGSIAPVHYRIDVPPDATSLRIRLGRVTPDGTYRVYVREGAPVRFVASRTPPLIASGDFGADLGEIVLDRTTDPPLPRCETLYLAVVTEDLRVIGASLFEVSAELERSGLDEACGDPDGGIGPDDAGVPDAGIEVTPAGGGCSCRVGGRSGSGGGLFARGWFGLGSIGLGLIGIALRVRRRRARSAR